MKKYRIVKEKGFYYPQIRFLFWWVPLGVNILDNKIHKGIFNACSTEEKAKQIIRAHKLGKSKKPKIIKYL